MKRCCLIVINLIVFVAWLLPAAHGAPVVIRMGHDGATAQPYHPALELTAKIIAEKTNNEVNLQIFPSGQLGSQQEQMLATIQGTQEMWMSNPAWLAQYSPRVGILGAAYLFRDLDHMYKVLRGPIGEDLFKELPAKIGVRIIDVWYLGTRQTTLRDKPASTPEEFKGIKLRAPGAPTYIEAVRVLGANPTPMGFGEVYMALKTGVIDGQENPVDIIVSSRLYEVQNHITVWNYSYDALILGMNKKQWDSLPAAARAIIKQAAIEASKQQVKLSRDAARTQLSLLRDKGMTITELTPDQVKAFRATTDPVYTEWSSKIESTIKNLQGS